MRWRVVGLGLKRPVLFGANPGCGRGLLDRPVMFAAPQSLIIRNCAVWSMTGNFWQRAGDCASPVSPFRWYERFRQGPRNVEFENESVELSDHTISQVDMPSPAAVSRFMPQMYYSNHPSHACFLSELI